jgi:S-adenosylmethionine:tRNA ribosyltransferase-isomerase
VTNRLDDYDYELPPDRIAQTPVEPRDAARLLVVHRETGALEHRIFRDIPGYLRAGDVLVVNSSRVRAARLHARKATGGRVELLLLKPVGEGQWECLVSPGRRVPPGTALSIEGGPDAEVLSRTEAGGRIVRFAAHGGLDAALEAAGEVPLPPYITAPLTDRERYQTVYARTPGSAAAPTAGLHFTPALLDTIRAMGVTVAEIDLHIGLDTFRPVKVDDLDRHIMHSEWYHISAEAAEAVNTAAGRVVAVGTTSVRALESAADQGRVRAGAAETRLFLRPGVKFQIVDALITNFHLPKSTLLMLVSAFASRDLMLESYRTAVREDYRFFSFGDAMLIL